MMRAIAVSKQMPPTVPPTIAAMLSMEMTVTWSFPLVPDSMLVAGANDSDSDSDASERLMLTVDGGKPLSLVVFAIDDTIGTIAVVVVVVVVISVVRGTAVAVGEGCTIVVAAAVFTEAVVVG